MIDDVKKFELLKFLDSRLSSPIKLMSGINSIEFFYNDDRILKFYSNSNNLEFTFKYDESIHKEYFRVIFNLIREFGCEVFVKNNYMNRANKLAKDVEADDRYLVESNKESYGKCKQSAYDFFNILSRNGYYAQRGVLVYLNSELVGLLKIVNNPLLLSFGDSRNEKLAVYSLNKKLVGDIIKNVDKVKDEKKDWIRINFIGNSLPINFDPMERSRYLHNFEEIMKLSEFSEMDLQNSRSYLKIFKFKSGKTKISIYKKLLNLIKCVYESEKSFNGNFDYEIKLGNLK